MVSTVTVLGAHSSVETLNFDLEAHAQLARVLAAAVTNAVKGGELHPASSQDGPPPLLRPRQHGEFVQNTDGFTWLPRGYDAVVNVASNATIVGSGARDETVLSSNGNMTYLDLHGSGTIDAGGGDNRLLLGSSAHRSWLVETGNGDDTIVALGNGHNSIDAGGGHNLILLGGGSDIVTVGGHDTIFATPNAHVTIVGAHQDDVVLLGSAHATFIDQDAGSVSGGGASHHGNHGGPSHHGAHGWGSHGPIKFPGSEGAEKFFAAMGNETLHSASALTTALASVAGAVGPMIAQHGKPEIIPVSQLLAKMTADHDASGPKADLMGSAGSFDTLHVTFTDLTKFDKH
ncbi:MAG: hypothetical protein J0H67_16910 [Rhodospirillales bacterium]|nr:hypothetical protein [Rhodospirillales bacterium]